MKQKSFTTITLIADEDKFLTQASNSIEIQDRELHKVISLGKNDSPDNWIEISAEEAEQLKNGISISELEETFTELGKIKNSKINEINTYTSSEEINSFFLNGLQVHLDKSTRTQLMNQVSTDQEAGKSETTLRLNGVKITIEITLASQMLSILESYILNCINKTVQHKNNVQELTTIESVLSYDYTIGYPEKPKFNI